MKKEKMKIRKGISQALIVARKYGNVEIMGKGTKSDLIFSTERRERERERKEEALKKCVNLQS